MALNPKLFVLFVTVLTGSLFQVAENCYAQQLILYYDFEGDSSLNIEDISGFETPANGLLVGGTSSIIPDGDAARGDVLDTGSTGFGATVPHARKMDFRTSFTLQAWIKTANANGVFQQIAGIGGSGPRIFNHWGLGSLGTAQLFNTEFNLFDGFTPVEIVSPSGFVDGTSWHHILVTWNAAESKIYGYYDGFDGGDPNDPGLTPVDTLGDILIAHEDVFFDIGGVTGGAGAIPNTRIDDVAFWQGYAPPTVVAGLFDGSIAVADAAAMMILPTASGDIDGDGDVDGADFLSIQRGFGLDDLATLAVTKADGDANGDLKVDGLDIALWQSQYGTVIPITTVVAVPEPSSFLVMVSALIAIGGLRRHKAA